MTLPEVEPVIEMPKPTMEEPKPVSPSFSSDRALRSRLGHQEALLAALLVVVLTSVIGGSLMLYLHNVRLSSLSTDTMSSMNLLARSQSNVSDLQMQVQEVVKRLDALDATSSTSSPAVSVSGTVFAPSASGTLPVAETKTAMATSPSGAIVRGSLSPDGTKYAGYDVVTPGKKGVAVEVVGETRIRHIVIFNPSAESSGLGLPEEPTMSVRWLDNQTIEYDVILKKAGGVQERTTETVKIYF